MALCILCWCVGVGHSWNKTRYLYNVSTFNLDGNYGLRLSWETQAILLSSFDKNTWYSKVSFFVHKLRLTRAIAAICNWLCCYSDKFLVKKETLMFLFWIIWRALMCSTVNRTKLWIQNNHRWLAIAKHLGVFLLIVAGIMEEEQLQLCCILYARGCSKCYF